jgi:Tol biopolymer transport system component
VRAERPRGTLLSPDGQWLAYFVTLGDEAAENGLWLVRTDGTERRQLDRELFGSYQWRDAHRLLILPFQPAATWHELWEYDLRTGQARRLTDPDVTPFKVANGDWQVSPDGRHVAFVASQDRNIWVLTLAE